VKIQMILPSPEIKNLKTSVGDGEEQNGQRFPDWLIFTVSGSVEIAISGTWTVVKEFSLLIAFGNEREGKKSNAQLKQKKSNSLQLLKSLASHKGLSPSSGMHFKMRILPEPVNFDKPAAGIDSFQLFSFFSTTVLP